MKNITLSELVKTHPVATSFLNEKHIDYCCGGSDNLYQAIAGKNYEVKTFVSELEKYLEEQESKVNSPIDVDLYTLDIPELITHLKNTHHKHERDLFSTIDEKLSTILSVHYNHHKAELIEVFKLYNDLRKELLVHFVQEEQEVFPLMLEPPTLDSIAKLEALEKEHKAAGDIIKELERATNNFSAPADSCVTYELTYALLKELVEDIFIHVYKENSILFSRYKEGVIK